jgi:hypothetical protein
VNYANFHPLQPRKNEPKTNPILPVVLPTDCCWGLQFCRVCNLFAHAESYSGQDLPSSWFPATTAYLYPTANKKMRNEPNFKNTEINLNPVKTKNYENKRLVGQRKNEPNTNPILSTGPSIDQFEQNMQNEPNLKNTKKTVTNVPGKDYMKNDAFEPPKNEPNRTQFHTFLL